ncbi:Brp/Blh family beta-carotene 15,15'-dioxygenase [Ekhidna sp.]
MSRLIQYSLALVFGLSMFVLDDHLESYTQYVCVGLILIFGIPHGALDHKIHQTTNNNSKLGKYIVKYLLIAGAYIVWWLIDPFKALFFFILLSSYHFGQEILQEHGIKRVSLISSMIWGLAILGAPMIYDFQEVSAFISTITSTDLGSISGVNSKIISGSIYLIALFDLLVKYKKEEITSSSASSLIIFLLTIITLHLSLDFVVAFTLYFVFFHSLNAFKHQYRWLSNKYRNYSMKKFVTDLLGFAVLAVIGIIFILWILDPEDNVSLITLFFVLVSLITLPHAITLDQLYRIWRN